MQLSIISPDKDIFSGEVSSVTVPGIDGSLGILNNHAPLISALGNGDIVLTENNKEQTINIKGGVIEVLNNNVIILAD